MWFIKTSTKRSHNYFWSRKTFIQRWFSITPSFHQWRDRLSARAGSRTQFFCSLSSLPPRQWKQSSWMFHRSLNKMGYMLWGTDSVPYPVKKNSFLGTYSSSLRSLLETSQRTHSIYWVILALQLSESESYLSPSEVQFVVRNKMK